MSMNRRTFLGRAVATLAAAAAISQGHVPAAIPEAAAAPQEPQAPQPRWGPWQMAVDPLGFEHHDQPYGFRTRWVQLVDQDGNVIQDAGARPVEFLEAEPLDGYARSESRNEIVFNTPEGDWGTVTWARILMQDGRPIADIPLKFPRSVDETDNAPAFQAGALVVELS